MHSTADELEVSAMTAHDRTTALVKASLIARPPRKHVEPAEQVMRNWAYGIRR
jgi:hypothetical protein